MGGQKVNRVITKKLSKKQVVLSSVCYSFNSTIIFIFVYTKGNGYKLASFE